MAKVKINTEEAPKALGPYSQGIAYGNLIFVSGQLPIDPLTGKLIEGDMQELTKRVIANMQAILAASGCSLDNVVRVDIFLKDIKRDFASMNEEYGKWFNTNAPPARQTVQVSELPMGSPIEMSCIAGA